MNIIFFSPHFPRHCTEFCFHLKDFGANVLGIGDADFHSLNDRLKGSLSEYYRVGQMDNYDEVLKAVGYFTHRYGKIDRFESLNEHWLETEARIRTDFNIHGTRIDFVYNLRQKSKMKDFFKRSGVRTVRFILCDDKLSAKKFVSQVGYPIVAKPDRGSGANLTFRINNELELENFFNNKPGQVEFILEEYVDGIVLTYDGLVDIYGSVQFATTHQVDQSIMDVVNNDDHIHYYGLKGTLPEVEEAGRRILKSFDVRERFFHIELFKTRKDGQIIALEVNMRPPGGWITDAINFTYDMNIYREWANMVVNNRFGGPYTAKYFVGYASRKDHKRYVYSHEEVLQRFADKIVNHGPIESILSRATGNYAYQFRSTSLDEVKELIAFIQQEQR